MKKNRQEAILSLVEQENIGTQEELMTKLNALGYSVTQATVSRDIKALGLVKLPVAEGRYKYALSKSESQSAADKFYSILRNSVHTLENAGNLVVVKCFAGMANAACAAVDALIAERIVGSLAGDDTFLVVCRDESGAKDVCDLLKSFLNR